MRVGKAERGLDHGWVQGDPLPGVPQGQAAAELLRVSTVFVVVVGIRCSCSDQPRAAYFSGTQKIQEFVGEMEGVVEVDNTILGFFRKALMSHP